MSPVAIAILHIVGVAVVLELRKFWAMPILVIYAYWFLPYIEVGLQ